jgi:hypothetical protein
LQYGGLGLQALEFGVTKLQTDELGFGLFGEGFDFVGLVVYGDGGHDFSFGWGWLMEMVFDLARWIAVLRSQ